MATIRPAAKVDSPVRQDASDFARRRLDLDAFKASDRRVREIRIREAVQRVWVVQSQGKKYSTSVFPKFVFRCGHPTLEKRSGSRSSRTLGWDAVDAGSVGATASQGG
jgi:hypothetical protein